MCYSVGAAIGKGAFGNVFEAVVLYPRKNKLKKDQRVAIKMVRQCSN
jgi:uncharacterized protein YeeX (DUF496 family)